MEVKDAVQPLNKLLRDLHGPSANVGRTIDRLVGFPDLIESSSDADVLDLSIAASLVSADSFQGNVRARVRYATSARISQLEHFYMAQFEAANATFVQRSEAADGDRVAFDVVLPWRPCPQQSQAISTAFHVVLTADRGYRAVAWTAEYESPDLSELWGQFARWHNGDAPVTDACRPTGVDVATYAIGGRRPETQVLYSTHYHCSDTPGETRRARVEDRIRELGWNYRETREGILFMRDAAFEAETHVIGDEHSSCVTFVGEFQLR